ncbi:MAG TPA: CHAT domain-containing protein, partial [Gemmatimonadaceae bacterium]
AFFRGLEVPAIPAAKPSDAARVCEILVRVYTGRPVATPREMRLLAVRYPKSATLQRLYLESLRFSGDFDAMARYAESLASSRQPHIRALGHANRAIAEHERGRDAAALAIEERVRSEADWLMPGFREHWIISTSQHALLKRLNRAMLDTVLLRHTSEVVAEGEELRLAAAQVGDQVARLALTSGTAVGRLDRGWIHDAVQLMEGLPALSDSVGDIGARAHVRMRLGRAYVKRGLPREAERWLLEARVLSAVAAMPAVQKEVEHNLLHLYETQRRDDEALAAGRAFERFATLGGLHAVRMMSRRDLGMFLRARGAIAESRVEFEKMMADIEALGSNWFYAGEYLELTGNLSDAVSHYDRAIRDGDEPVRALEGLVRVRIALGDTAEALSLAHAHDSRRDAVGRPESAPLLPSVLASVGETERARAAFQEARATVARHGQVAAWAALTTDLAALELKRGVAGAAGVLADSATAAARDVGATTVVLRAQALGAMARWTANRDGASFSGLRAMALQGASTAGPALRAELNRLVAAALAIDGRWKESLAWYDRAAAALDSVAAGIPLDIQQASYRAAQRGVYDDALSTIVSHAGDPAASDLFHRWSSNRKERAYGMAKGHSAPARLRAAAKGTAIVDYVLLDSVIGAQVSTAAGTAIVDLGRNSAAVLDAVHRLRRAVDVRVGGSIDLTRATYPLSIAHELYALLLRPLEPYLQGVETLVVVPDGALNLVPFDALVTAMPPDGRDERRAGFLIDRFAVVLSVSPDVNTRAWHPAMRPVVAVAPSSDLPSVPGTEAELTAIREAVGAGRFVPLQGDKATREGVERAASTGPILHFITHAWANDVDPGASWLALSPADDHDGLLEAREIASLVFQSPLVVLSGCETASGRALDGEGVLSLSRSFLRAGAAATIATLWPIGPLAAEFPGPFYRSAGSGVAAPDAVRHAKRQLRDRGVPAFAWAPYQLVTGTGRR